LDLSRKTKLYRVLVVVAFFFGGWFCAMGSLGVLLGVTTMIAGALFFRSFTAQVWEEARE
jgi:predicted PurR-regulated permease PerM